MSTNLKKWWLYINHFFIQSLKERVHTDKILVDPIKPTVMVKKPKKEVTLLDRQIYTTPQMYKPSLKCIKINQYGIIHNINFAHLGTGPLLKFNGIVY
mgnify:CR=1 FL=1